MTRDVRARIADGRVHVLDGAMGTMLYDKGLYLNVCYDEVTLRQPQLIREVHEAYVRAGAELIETNTFGANALKLAGYGLADEVAAINRTAAELAREVAGNQVGVLGAIGPLGVRIEPYGATGRDEARALFREQAAALAAGGVDGFILETFADLTELHAALEGVREASELPVIAQMTITEDGTTAYGTAPELIATTLTGWGADVVGLNCSVGPAVILEAIERMATATDRPLSAPF